MMSAASLCTVLAACDLSTAPEVVECDPALRSFGAVTGDTVTTQTGLRYVEIETGSGASAGLGSGVAVHYSLYLRSSGAFLQSSCGSNTLDFPVGAQGIIPGFQEGIIGMREGGVRRLIVPPNLAYGEAGQGQIPGNATIIFDVHLARID